jgi:hypothetical protein
MGPEVAPKSPEAILADAKAAFQQAKSVVLRGSVDDNGERISLNLLTQDKGPPGQVMFSKFNSAKFP